MNEAYQKRPTIMKNAALRFFLFFVGIYGLWYLVYEFWIAEHTPVDAWLIELVGKGSDFLLHLIGFDSSYNVPHHTIFLGSIACVSVGAPCNGLALFALFASFILATPSSWKSKAFFIPLGIVVIFVLNVIRVAALAVNAKYYPASLAFNHHYLFAFIVYGFTFWLWIIWVNRFMLPSLKQK